MRTLYVGGPIDARVDELDYSELPPIKRRVPIDFEPGNFFEGDENDKHCDRQIPTLESVFRYLKSVGYGCNDACRMWNHFLKAIPKTAVSED